MKCNRLLLACAMLSASATMAWSQDTLQVELSKSFHGNRFRYDLSQLSKGEYIVTLSIDGKKESRKYSRR